MKPPFPYFGGKTRLAERIVERFPEHLHYVEPFFGAGSILLAKPISATETVNDIDGDVVCFFQILRDRPDELERVCALTPHSRAEYETSKSRDQVDELERARRVFVHLTQSRASTLRPTGWHHRLDSHRGDAARSRPRYLHTLTDRFAGIAERLLNVTFECRDGIDVIRDYGRRPDVLLYVDPPYLHTSRSARGGSGGYAHEFGRADQHAELLDALAECTAAVIVSGYDSALYRDRLATWERTSLIALDGAGQKRQEVIWQNRPAHPALFEVTA